MGMMIRKVVKRMVMMRKRLIRNLQVVIMIKNRRIKMLKIKMRAIIKKTSN